MDDRIREEQKKTGEICKYSTVSKVLFKNGGEFVPSE